MNGDVQVLKTDLNIFGPKLEKSTISVVEIIEKEEIEVSLKEVKISAVKETRFARLKKSLRKRSGGIL